MVKKPGDIAKKLDKLARKPRDIAKLVVATRERL